jgi:glycosyltransferase involved in cell wall biosynthesis
VRAGVVVPVHGWSPYLAETLDAILGEEPAAVVVVDDGSPDPLELHPDHAPHCTLVRRDQQGGIAAARATGERALDPALPFVAQCDADDTWTRGSLARRLEALADADVAFGSAVVIGGDNRPTGEVWDTIPAGVATLLPRLYERNDIPVSSAVVRRAALHAAGGYEGDFPQAAEDWDLWLRMLARDATFVSVPDAVVRYRRHPGGFTADVSGLARAQLRLHRAHGHLVSARVRARALARDRRALARDRLRRASYVLR